jgi:hypothetical protein
VIPLKRFRLDRRAMLRGMTAGVSVAVGLPMLEAMLNANGTAYADGHALPVRFVNWFFGNGVILPRWTPAAQGTGWEVSEELAPLADVKSHVSVLSGFNNATAGRRGHHDGQAGMCSCIPFIELTPEGGAPYASRFGGPSIDQVLATRIGGQTLIPSLEIGVSKRNIHGEGPTLEAISFASGDQPILPELNPQAVWTRLFGNFVPVDDPSNDLRQHALDVVRGDIARLTPKVSAADRIRLEKHLDGISQLEAEISALPPTCTTPEMTGETNADIDGQEQLESVNAAMADLLVYAFQCDITRICGFLWSGGVSQAIYWPVGITSEQHGLSHLPDGQDMVHQTVVFEMQMLAALLTRMRDCEEGDFTMLDNAVVLVGSDVAEGYSHGANDHPILVCGKGGGALGPSTHHRSPSGESMSKVILTALQAVDPTLTEIGADSGYTNETVSELEA